MTELEPDLQQQIETTHPELADQHEEAEFGIFPTLKDRVNVLTRLKLLGIREVRVEFSGGGDDGSINDVECVSADNSTISIEDERIEGWATRGHQTHDGTWQSDIVREDMKLRELLENMCNDALEKSSLDWYNNEGGQGHLIIDFSESPPNIRLEVGINTMQTDDHMFNL